MNTNKHIKTFILLYTIFLFSVSLKALSPGDIAFVAFNHEGDDDFAIVALVDLPFLTDIFFTDNEINSLGDNLKDTNEGIIRWTVNVGGAGVTAGTIIHFNDIASNLAQNVTLADGTPAGTITETGNFSLATSHDAVVAYQAGFKWLAGYERGLSTTETGFWGNSGLTIGEHVLDAGNSTHDGGYYIGMIAGASSYSDYLPLINDPTKWTYNNNSEAFILPNFPTTSFSLVLPVELGAFTAYDSEDGVILKWQTITEQNNLGFEIHHSIDGTRWAELSFINGNGTTQEEQYYDYTDKFPQEGFNYYRLKQIDTDGAFDFSYVVVVNCRNEINDLSFEIGPNPASDYLNYWFGENGEPVTISIFDANGRRIAMYSKQPEHGTISVVELNAGIYFIQMTSSNKTSTKEFIIK